MTELSCALFGFFLYLSISNYFSYPSEFATQIVFEEPVRHICLPHNIFQTSNETHFEHESIREKWADMVLKCIEFRSFLAFLSAIWMPSNTLQCPLNRPSLYSMQCRCHDFAMWFWRDFPRSGVLPTDQTGQNCHCWSVRLPSAWRLEISSLNRNIQLFYCPFQAMDRFEMYKNAKLAHMILSQQIPESSREMVSW